MNGYYNYSMSNNALDAYEEGQKPRSKWEKGDFQGLPISQEKQELINKTSVKKLREHCLKWEGWHHTSNHYNQTDFYSIDIEWLNEQPIELLKELFSQKEEKPKERKAYCSYLEWSGTRKHPKATRYESDGVIKGEWFHLPNGKRKKVSANGFEIIKEYE